MALTTQTWSPVDAGQQEKSVLRHRDIVDKMYQEEREADVAAGGGH